MSANLKLYKEEGGENEEGVSKEEYVVNYLKSMIAIEQAMEPYKEQKKELRKEYTSRYLECNQSLAFIRTRC